MEDSVKVEAKAKKEKAVEYVLAKGGRIKLHDFPLEITDETLKNPRVIDALASYEGRTGNKVFGLHVISK